MKKHIFLAGLIASTFVFFTGCSKEDTEAPVIELLGDNPVELAIFEEFEEPGFTATDDEDGDLTSIVTVDYSGLAISFPTEIAYSVTDDAGNVGTASRAVDSETRTYNVVDSCGTGASLQIFTYTQTVNMENSSTIGFNKFADYAGNSGIVATFTSAGQISLSSQLAQDIGSSADDHRFSGSGSVLTNGFRIVYTDENITTSSITTCNATFVE